MVSIGIGASSVERWAHHTAQVAAEIDEQLRVLGWDGPLLVSDQIRRPRLHNKAYPEGAGARRRGRRPHRLPARRAARAALFKPLRLDEIEQIVELLMQDLRDRLVDRGVTLTMSEAAREHVAREGYDPVFGARPLKRYLQHQLETRIGRALIAGEAGEGSVVDVGVRDGALEVAIVPAEVAVSA